jgi:hypothetical protein
MPATVGCSSQAACDASRARTLRVKRRSKSFELCAPLDPMCRSCSQGIPGPHHGTGTTSASSSQASRTLYQLIVVQNVYPCTTLCR